ncbi:MAG: hypothetical protein HY689_02240 [Chloroflexi bacterium]|nr:hypothetical protein [Chloroflexota bacterium]
MAKHMVSIAPEEFDLLLRHTMNPGTPVPFVDAERTEDGNILLIGEPAAFDRLWEDFRYTFDLHWHGADLPEEEVNATLGVLMKLTKHERHQRKVTWGDRLLAWFGGDRFWDDAWNNAYAWYVNPYLTVIITLPLGLWYFFWIVFTVLHFLGIQISGVFWNPPLGTIAWILVGWEFLSIPIELAALAVGMIYLGLPAIGHGSLPCWAKPVGYLSVIIVGSITFELLKSLQVAIMNLLGIPWIFEDRMSTIGAGIAFFITVGAFLWMGVNRFINRRISG